VSSVVHEDWAKLGYRLDWEGFPFAGIASPRPVALVAYDDMVVTQDANSAVTVLETSTGRRRWSTDLTGPNTRWLGISRLPGEQGSLLVSADTEAFVLAPGTGNLLGRDRFEQVISTPTLLVDNFLIGGTPTGRVQAHLLGKDLSAWGFISNGAFSVGPVAVGDTIAMVSQAGDVLFFGHGGSLLGRGHIFGALDAPPATDGQRLVIASRDQSLWSFASNGLMLWRYRTSNPLTQSPYFFGDEVVCDLGAEGLSGFDADAGTVRWSNKDAHGQVVAVRAGKLVVWDRTTLYLVDPKTGDVVAKAPGTGILKFATSKAEDGDLFMVAADGTLAKFLPR
jgi:outer membrane protein assembly factor BamB